MAQTKGGEGVVVTSKNHARYAGECGRAWSRPALNRAWENVANMTPAAPLVAVWSVPGTDLTGNLTPVM